MADDGTRPPLGFEFELALAIVDPSVITFDEAAFPAIVGTFEVIYCTQTIKIHPPTAVAKMIPCGYNPAAHVIPAQTQPGFLEFSGLNKAKADTMATYRGQVCVARVTAYIDGTVVRTCYCNYYTPDVEENVPDGDGESTISVRGMFAQLTKV